MKMGLGSALLIVSAFLVTTFSIQAQDTQKVWQPKPHATNAPPKTVPTPVPSKTSPTPAASRPSPTPAPPKPAHSAVPTVTAPIAGRVPVAPDELSGPTLDLVKLFERGENHDALMRYVKTSPKNFNLSVADVNYLKDLGVSTDVVFAMIRNDAARQNALAWQSNTGSFRPSQETGSTEEPTAAAPSKRSSAKKLAREIVEAAGAELMRSKPSPTTEDSYYQSFDNPKSRPTAPSYVYPYTRPYDYSGNGYNLDYRDAQPGYYGPNPNPYYGNPANGSVRAYPPYYSR
jgi:hypothetical protein